MKAVICTGYGSPEVLQLREVEKPVPKDHEVLIKVHASTVSAADFRVRSFTVPKSFWIPARLFLGLFKPKKNILGVELSGEIVATGKNVKRFKKGDKVFAATLVYFGGYAEYACLPEDGPIALKPVNSTYEEAAALPIGSRTALHFLKKGKIQAGQKVLIYGASGSVGTYAIQLARYFGAEVSAVCSGANLELVKSLGAVKAFDYTEKEYTKKLEMYDMIFVAVDKCSFSVYNQYLKEGGVYLNITDPVPSLPMVWTSMTSKKKIMIGGGPPKTNEDLLVVKELVEAGKLKPVIDRTYTLDQIVEAHTYVDRGHKKGNVVVRVM